MDVLRLAPYDKVDIEYVVPAGYPTDINASVTITDMSDLSETTTTYTGNTGDTWTFKVSGLYDNQYRIKITTIVQAVTRVLLDETYDVVRPYVDPNTLGTTATEIATATANEELARAIIDSVIPEGFYYKKIQYMVSGLGGDFIPLWHDAKKILAVYENNVLIEDRTYEITKDKSAIQQVYEGVINRADGAPNILPAAQSDSMDLIFGYGGFPREYDYRFILEAGYTSVPSDIARATNLLIDDISCGKLDYYKRFISAYNTEQFRIQFDKSVFQGTGNLLVDKILSKYAKSITRLGVL
jgi:hypothetical protein